MQSVNSGGNVSKNKDQPTEFYPICRWIMQTLTLFNQRICMQLNWSKFILLNRSGKLRAIIRTLKSRWDNSQVVWNNKKRCFILFNDNLSCHIISIRREYQFEVLCRKCKIHKIRNTVNISVFNWAFMVSLIFDRFPEYLTGDFVNLQIFLKHSTVLVYVKGRCGEASTSKQRPA